MSFISKLLKLTVSKVFTIRQLKMKGGLGNLNSNSSNSLSPPGKVKVALEEIYKRHIPTEALPWDKSLTHAYKEIDEKNKAKKKNKKLKY